VKIAKLGNDKKLAEKAVRIAQTALNTAEAAAANAEEEEKTAAAEEEEVAGSITMKTQLKLQTAKNKFDIAKSKVVNAKEVFDAAKKTLDPIKIEKAEAELEKAEAELILAEKAKEKAIAAASELERAKKEIEDAEADVAAKKEAAEAEVATKKNEAETELKKAVDANKVIEQAIINTVVAKLLNPEEKTVKDTATATETLAGLKKVGSSINNLNTQLQARDSIFKNLEDVYKYAPPESTAKKPDGPPESTNSTLKSSTDKTPTDKDKEDAALRKDERRAQIDNVDLDARLDKESDDSRLHSREKSPTQEEKEWILLKLGILDSNKKLDKNIFYNIAFPALETNVENIFSTLPTGFTPDAYFSTLFSESKKFNVPILNTIFSKSAEEQSESLEPAKEKEKEERQKDIERKIINVNVKFGDGESMTLGEHTPFIRSPESSALLVSSEPLGSSVSSESLGSSVSSESLGSSVSPELTLDIIEDVILLSLEKKEPVASSPVTDETTTLDIIEDVVQLLLEKEASSPVTDETTTLDIIEDVIMLYNPNKPTNV
jgi:hypothetical protein